MTTTLLQQQLQQYHLILASQSPRRQQLLRDLGFDFSTISTHIKESYPSNLQREDIPLFLASLKADALQKQLKSNDILITADTIVWANNTALNKPQNTQEAYKMLKQLSEQKHIVITAVQLTSIKKTKTFFSETEVYFSSLDDEEIDFYIQNYQPFDKAGAYGIQEWIGYIGVEKIKGSYFNVMGLPVHQLYKELKQFL